jgi:nucleoside-diphosphate-sugar epimerase
MMRYFRIIPVAFVGSLLAAQRRVGYIQAYRNGWRGSRPSAALSRIRGCQHLHRTFRAEISYTLARGNEDKMRYLVTGGAGFIGSHVVDELLRRDHSVAVLDDLSTGHERNLAGMSAEIDLTVGSICDHEAVTRACRGADYVIHLAARTSVPRSVKQPLETNRVNVEGTLRVLMAARESGAHRVVFSASSSVYGETAVLPKVEAMPPAPISPYGVSKLAGEHYAQVFTRVYGLETVSLRYFNVFGPRQDPDSPYSGVLSRFLLAAREGAQPVVYGDGEQSRDFTYVENVVDATLRACEAPGAAARVFNVGVGGRVTLNQVLHVLEQIAQRPLQARYDPPRSGDILHSQADISLAHEVLGYVPRVGWEDGLRRTWQWFQSGYEK